MLSAVGATAARRRGASHGGFRWRGAYPLLVAIVTLGCAVTPAWYVVAPNDANWVLVFFSFHPMLGVLVTSIVAGTVCRSSWKERWPRIRRWVLLAFLGSFAFVSSTVASTAWFEANAPARLEEAVAFCDELRPRLEAHRSEHGSYPTSIEPVLGTVSKPVLLWGAWPWYRTNGDAYEFRINTSRGMAFRGAVFDSAAGAWRMPNSEP